jgi:hypothetical protein
MMGRTEDRLRDATRALGQVIQHQDIPALRLTAAGSRRARGFRRARGLWPGPGRRPGHRPPGRMARLIPLGAAAAVLAVSGLVFGIGQTRHDHHPAVQPPPATLPRYLVTFGGGAGFVPGGGPGYVRLAATGAIVARIRPAAPDFTIEGLAAAPGGRTFYLIGEEPAQPPHVRIVCFRLVLGPGGQPGVPKRLAGRPLLALLPYSSNGVTSVPLAVSPDGTELAYPSPGPLPEGSGLPSGTGSQSIIVQNVATGARRSWSAWPGTHAQVSQVSWAAGSALGFTAALADVAVAHGNIVPDPASELNVFMILNTTAGGSGLIADSRLVAYGAASVSATGPKPNPPPGPYGGMLSQDGLTAYVQIHPAHGPDRLVALSAASGEVIRVLLTGRAAAESAPLSIDGNHLLFALPVPHGPPPANASPWVSGHLADFSLTTGRITRLPFALYSNPVMPAAPLEVAW